MRSWRRSHAQEFKSSPGRIQADVECAQERHAEQAVQIEIRCLVEQGCGDVTDAGSRTARFTLTTDNGGVIATFEIITLTAWCPHESQQKPLRPGSAKSRLADALGVPERKPEES